MTGACRAGVIELGVSVLELEVRRDMRRLSIVVVLSSWLGALIEAIGLPLAAKLEPFAITSATELVNVNTQPMPDAIAKAFADSDTSVKRLADRLAADPRVDKIQRWLDDSRVVG
jgi:hypothetical protein